MTIELRVARGARAGHRQTFDAEVVTLGREARSDLRFDAEQDLDVSARHAELRRRDGRWFVADRGSTNGTFVNGTRIGAEHELRDGDAIALGRDGPRIEVGIAGAAALRPPPTRPAPRVLRPTSDSGRVAGATGDAAPRVPGRRTTERIALAVRERTGSLRRALVLVTTLLIVGLGAAFWLGRRGIAERDARLAAMLVRHDSLGAVFEREIQGLAGRLSGLDASLAQARGESDALRLELERERTRATAEVVERLASRLAAAESRHGAMVTAARMDHASIAAANDRAVVLIAVEMPDGSRYTGTGFGVAADGTIITNRHVVQDSLGNAPRRLAVIFTDTRRWLAASVLQVSRDAELATIRVQAPGRYPTVTELAGDDAPLAAGEPVTVIGYPLGMETPMPGTGASFVARASLGVGTVSKVLPEVVQIDAWAGQGSSGSPVFDQRGHVAGVVFGGARESGGRIVYAVPASAVRALLGVSSGR